jgi:hypothetical protein
MNKQPYRATIFFTEDKYKDTPPSNIFLNAISQEAATEGATKLFQKQLAANGLAGAQFKLEVRLSSETEITEYIASRRAGHRTTGVIN